MIFRSMSLSDVLSHPWVDWLFQCRKCTNVLMTTIMLSNAGLAVLVLYWIIEPDPIVYSLNEVWSDSNDKETTSFSPGDVAYLNRDVCTRRSINVTIGRRLISVDGRVSVPLQGGVSTLKSGCTHLLYSLLIPGNLPHNTYRYVVNGQIFVNPLRTTTVENNAPVIYVIQRGSR